MVSHRQHPHSQLAGHLQFQFALFRFSATFVADFFGSTWGDGSDSGWGCLRVSFGEGECSLRRKWDEGGIIIIMNSPALGNWWNMLICFRKNHGIYRDENNEGMDLPGGRRDEMVLWPQRGDLDHREISKIGFGDDHASIIYIYIIYICICIYIYMNMCIYTI